jgi:hypothetical protein
LAVFVTESDPRVWDAVQRWFRMPKLELWEPSPCFKFIVSPEGDAGVLVEIREERRFACINTEPNLGYCSIPRRLQPPSTAPDVAVVFGTVRYPLTYFGDDRIIGALKTQSLVLLLVNLGIQVALVILALTDPSNFRVVWTGIGSQVPELDQNLQPVARAASPPNLQPVARIGSVLLAPPAPPPSAPVQVSSAASLPDDSGRATPRVGPTTTREYAARGRSFPRRPVHDRHAPAGRAVRIAAAVRNEAVARAGAYRRGSAAPPCRATHGRAARHDGVATTRHRADRQAGSAGSFAGERDHARG